MIEFLLFTAVLLLALAVMGVLGEHRPPRCPQAQQPGEADSVTPVKPVPIILRYICRDCNRRHSTRTVIGRKHLHLARPPNHVR